MTEKTKRIIATIAAEQGKRKDTERRRTETFSMQIEYINSKTVCQYFLGENFYA